MLEITSATTIPMLREHAAANNIDLRGLTRRDDIIAAIQEVEAANAAAGGANNATGSEEASGGTITPPADENAAEGANNATGDGDKQADEDTPPAGDTEQPPDDEKEGDDPPGEDKDGKPPDPPADGVVLKRVLFASRLLMTGDDVDAVHAALIDRGLHVGTDSTQGIYGAKTAVAVRHFQAKNRLIVDGRVGKFTAAALGFAWEG